MSERRPGTTIAAVLAIAIGLAVSSAAFSLVNALRLKPLGRVDTRELCVLRAWDPVANRSSFGMPLEAFAALASETPSFERVAAYRYWNAALPGAESPQRAQGYRVSGETFALLRAPARLGRTLDPSDAVPGAPRVVVLSHGLWQRRFGGDPAVLGRSIALDGEPHRIVGVMPARFEFPVHSFKGELWVPLPVDAAAALAFSSSSGAVVALGRLRKGASSRAAEAEVRAAFERRAAAQPVPFRTLSVRVLSLRQLGIGESRPPMLALLASVFQTWRAAGVVNADARSDP